MISGKTLDSTADAIAGCKTVKRFGTGRTTVAAGVFAIVGGTLTAAAMIPLVAAEVTLSTAAQSDSVLRCKTVLTACAAAPWFLVGHTQVADTMIARQAGERTDPVVTVADACRRTGRRAGFRARTGSATGAAGVDTGIHYAVITAWAARQPCVTAMIPCSTIEIAEFLTAA